MTTDTDCTCNQLPFKIAHCVICGRGAAELHREIAKTLGGTTNRPVASRQGGKKWYRRGGMRKSSRGGGIR